MADRHWAWSREARMARTRPIWVGSTAGSICSVSIGAGSLVVKRFTPTTMLSPPSIFCCAR